MKIGNAAIPVADRTQLDPRRQPAKAGEAQSAELTADAPSKVRRDVAPEARKLSADEAMDLARQTRDMIAENNRQAVQVNGSLDPRKLLDLLA